MRIILFLLKCIVGLLATVGFFLVALVVVASLAWEQVAGLKPTAPEAPESMVLVLDLAPGIVETKPDNPLSRASLGRVQGLRQTLEALDRAAEDSRVQGLLIRSGRGLIGLAQAQELREAISRFRDSVSSPYPSRKPSAKAVTARCTTSWPAARMRSGCNPPAVSI